MDNVGAIIKFIGPNAEAFGVFLLLSLNASAILLSPDLRAVAT